MKLLRRESLIFASVLFGILPIGCGGGSQGTGAIAGGIGKSVRVNMLTEEQQAHVCEAFKFYYVEEFKDPEANCTEQATFAGVLAEPPSKDFCETTYQECLAEFTPPEVPYFIDEEVCPRLKNTRCDVTLGTIDTCFQKRVEMRIASQLRLSCDLSEKLNSDQLIDYLNEGFDENRIPECVEWNEKCPLANE